MELANRKTRGELGSTHEISGRNHPGNDIVPHSSESHWKEILTNSGTQLTELTPFFKRHILRALTAYLFFRLIYLVAKTVFRMEVKGDAVLRTLALPYLLCPNHLKLHSILFWLVRFCRRVYSRRLFSEYFTGTTTSYLAPTMKVVPIDPDVHLLRAMRAGAEVLRRGRFLVFFRRVTARSMENWEFLRRAWRIRNAVECTNRTRGVGRNLSHLAAQNATLWYG